MVKFSSEETRSFVLRSWHGDIRLEADVESLSSKSFGRIAVFMCTRVDVYKCYMCIGKHSSVGLHIKVRLSIHE